MDNKILKTVSVIIPCRNEERFIARCLDSVIANGYPQDLFEVFVVDGMSTDKTREIVGEYERKYKFIHLLENPKETAPAALNIGIKASESDIIIRLDAHTTYSNNYISKSVETLNNSGAANAGGIIKTMPGGNSLIAKAIALSISHPFGVGLSHFRLAKKVIKYVDTVPFGCFRRELFSKIGYFNEDLPRNEDIDFNFRIKKAGEKIILSHEIVSYYYARGTLKEFWCHNFDNGYLVTAPFKIKMNFAVRHVFPLISLIVFFLFIVLGFIYPLFHKVVFGIAFFYGISNLYFSFKTSLRQKNPVYLLIMPLIFFMLHAGYALGSVYGLLSPKKAICA